MTTYTNEYENPEIISIGTAKDIILGEKNLLAIDAIPGWPLFRRYEPWAFCGDEESAD